MANFYSNLNLKRNQLQLPVIHPSGSIPTGANIKGQLYFHNSADNEQLYLCVADGTDDGSSWVPLYNSISALSNGGMVVNAVATQNLQNIALGLTNLLAITNGGQALDGADVMAVHDVSGGQNGPRKVTMSQLKTFTNAGISGNSATTLDTGTVSGTSYGITSDGGTDDVIIAAATASDAGVMTAAMFADNALISGKANKASPAFTGDSTHSDATPSYTMTTTSDGALGGVFTFIKDPTTDGEADDGDSIGQFAFKGLNLSDVSHTYGKIEAFTKSTVDDAERGQIDMSVQAGGAETVGLSIVGDSAAGRVNVLIGNDADSTTTVIGNLTVSGTTTTVNTEEINLADNIIILNSNLADNTAPSQNGGWHVYRGDHEEEGSAGLQPARIIYDESVDKWKMDQGNGTLVEIGSSGDTMGSGFTVSATTDTNATTITENDDLFFAAGTGITCETTADGTVTITNTVTDSGNTVDMGSGFTVSATTDTNATTITENDDLFFAAGTGITCETTADGTVTITNTVTDSGNTVDMGSGFTVSATTDTNATTITENDDLFFAAGTGITCETTADGTVTITNTVTDSGNTVDMGSGFTVSATTDTNATTITENDDLFFAAGTGITCETTADGTVTITNTVTDSGNTQLSNAVAIIDVSALAASSQLISNITHGLGSHDISVQLWETTNGSVPYYKIDADIERTDGNTIKVTFGVIPPNDVRVVMIAENTADLAGTEVLYPS